jgi:transposase InsO family protein
VRASQAVHAAAVICRVLGVSVSGYHAWRRRPPSRRATEDDALTARIKAIHEMSDGTYSAPRIRAEVADVDGRRVGARHIARLMRKAGIAGVSRRRFCVTTTRDGSPASPDLVERKFEADGPNKLWVADITYVPTWAGFLFLAVVIDVWSRKVVGWARRRYGPGHHIARRKAQLGRVGDDASAFRRIPGPLSQKLIFGAVAEDEARGGEVTLRRALLRLVLSPAGCVCAPSGRRHLEFVYLATRPASCSALQARCLKSRLAPLSYAQ